MENVILAISVLALPIIVAITFHEAAHGWAAWKLGDDTALRLGRVSFNPVRHIDPFGTLLLPGLLALGQFLVGQWPPFVIGWAKPVPVDFMRLRNPRWGMVLVALAGPAINLVLAFASALLLHLAIEAPAWLRDWSIQVLVYSITINLILMIFNMLPIPPLDGGRVAVGVLPRPLARPLARFEQYGMLTLMAVIVLIPMIGSQLGQDWSVLPAILLPVEDWFRGVILRTTGLA
ncbi:MAG TPA: site-2 protease family protein [Azospirillaceae bacterium]|nr:site-2 protease family protein [Azospirillaceae bacterium]